MSRVEADSRVAQDAAALRRENNARLGERAVLMLAAPPLWTDTVARSLPDEYRFPVDDLTQFVDEAVGCGRAERRESVGPDGEDELRFWMPPAVRAQALSDLRDVLGAPLVAAEAVGLATALLDTAARVDVPPSVIDWARLIVAVVRQEEGTTDVAETALVEAVRHAVDADDLARAQQLHATGQSLAPLLRGGMDLVAQRTERLVDLGYRRRADARAVARYLRRRSVDAMVLELLTGDGPWALHLRGAGGVGKTMLIRDLASGRFAADNGIDPIVVVRADFDHITPDFPVREPIALLVTLADELALHAAADTYAGEFLAAFDRDEKSAREALASVRDAGGQADLEHRLVARAIEQFGQTLARLPGRVLLVLDTCEELAKAYPDDDSSPAVQATLGILERLHAANPDLRVLLCGRRPLPPRDYLVARELPGFTTDEGREFLTTFAARPLADDLRDVIIEQSPAIDEPGRLNPFDLALLLAWVDADPSLDAPRLAEAGPDAYVEARIIERLRDDELLAALPAVSALGEVTRAALRAAAAHGDALFDRLAQQEWIESDAHPARTLTVMPGLLRRLRAYFDADHRRAGARATTAQLADDVAEIVRATPVDKLETATITGALRIARPELAAAVWDDLVQRVEANDRWGWMLDVSRRVDGAAAEEQWPARAALAASVGAAYIAARRRASVDFDATALWKAVAETASAHPSPSAAAELATRAALGRLPEAGRDAPRLWATVQAAVPTPALGAAAVDCVDRLLERGARNQAREVVGTRLFSAALGGASGHRVAAWAQVIALRLDEPPEAGHGAPRPAWPTLQGANPPTSESAWADWLAPRDLPARVALELAVLALARATPLHALPLDDWERYARADLRGIDRERLASQCLRLRLAWAPVPLDQLREWDEHDAYQPGRRPTATIHDVVPPLFATLAEGYVGCGAAAEAFAIVDRYRSVALAARDKQADDSTQRAADASVVMLSRRLRTNDHISTVTRNCAGATQPGWLRDAARRALTILRPEAGLPPDAIGEEIRTDPDAWHAYWQCQVVTSRRAAAPMPLPEWAEAPAAPVALAIEVDLAEQRTLGVQVAAAPWLAGWIEAARAAPMPRRVDPFDAARAFVRRHAEEREPLAVPAPVPPRRLAEIAFEEGELAQLKGLPTAGRLLAAAADAFAAAGDAQGEVLALAAMDTGLESDGAAEARVEPVRAAALGRLRRAHPDHPLLAVTVALSSSWAYWHESVRPFIALTDPNQPGAAVAAPAPPSSAPGPEPSEARAPAALASADSSVATNTSATYRSPLERIEASEQALADATRQPWAARLFDIAAGVLGAVLALAGLALLYGSVDWLLSRVITDPPFVLTFAVFAAIPVLIATLAGSVRLADGRGLDVAPLRRLHVVVDVTGTDDGSPQVRVVVEPRRFADTPRWGWPALAANRAVMSPARVVHRRPRGYAGAVDVTSGAARLALVPAVGGRGSWWKSQKGQAPAVIRLPVHLVAHPWERMLHAAFGDESVGHLRWVRVVATGALADRPTATGRPGATVVAPPAWRDNYAHAVGVDVRDGWDGLGSQPSRRVLLLIGEPVVTPSGTRLWVGGGGTAPDAEVLLGADDIARQPATLVLVQRPPGGGRRRRAGDAEVSDSLALARELVDAGVEELMVLPAMNPAESRAILVALARLAGDSPDPEPPARMVGLVGHVHRILDEVDPALAADVIALVRVHDLAG